MSDELDVATQTKEETQTPEEKHTVSVEKEPQKNQPVKTTKPKKKARKKGVVTVTLIGIAEKLRFKRNGSVELWLNTDQTRKDTPIKGSPFPQKFTSTIFLNIPAYAAEKAGVAILKEGACLSVSARLRGVRRITDDGIPFDLVEVEAFSVSEFTDQPIEGPYKGINTSTIGGFIEKSELKKSGSYELWVNIDTSRKDTPIKGANVTSFFTSVIFARINAKIVKRIGKDAFEAGNILIIPGYLVGVNRVINGDVSDIVEFRAKDVIYIGKPNANDNEEQVEENSEPQEQGLTEDDPL